MTRVRRRFGADLVVTDGTGYRLGWATDVGRFDRLATTGLAREASPGAIRPLEAACAMWHGTPYVDLAELPAVEPERARIAELQAAVADRLAMSRLVAGDVRRAVTELVVLAEEDPYRECRWELLMRALDRDQRQGEAIAVYERLADRLANHLGVRPSDPPQRLRLDIPGSDRRRVGQAWGSTCRTRV